jgi:hypothetical protein
MLTASLWWLANNSLLLYSQLLRFCYRKVGKVKGRVRKGDLFECS